MARLTLGIETSCDETAVAVYHEDKGILSSVLYSQIAHHSKFGGVLPEVASRRQLEKINPMIQEALDVAQVALHDINVIAVTHKPGLPGSLLAGVCFAKSLAWINNKKLIGINHLEGHTFSPLIEHDVPFPHISLTASGGHTALYLVRGLGDYSMLGETVDDAAGEAFDKIARFMGFEYPGGPKIEQLAGQADFKDYFKYPRAMSKGLNFSFSGLKTAVLYDLIKKNAYDIKTKSFLKSDDEQLKQQVASSVLVCINDIFINKLDLVLKEYPDVKAVTFAGGVACNQFIKKNLTAWCAKKGLSFFAPSPKYCTDNGAMIAFVGNYKAVQNKFSDFNLDILR
jgi:N6-L-threonylcarbamoyladenine synthase